MGAFQRNKHLKGYFTCDGKNQGQVLVKQPV